MKINKSYIFLKGIRFYAYHGVAPQENLIGNEYIIDLKLGVDISKAMQTDEVTDTVNYAEVYNVIFATIEDIDLLLSKRNPPMGADIESAGIELHCSRK